MKNKLVQLSLWISKIDRSYIQASFFAFTMIAVLIGFQIMSTPKDFGPP